MDAIDFGLYALYLFIAVALIAAVILPVVNLFSNPKSLIRIGIGLVALLAVFFAVYSVSDGTLSPKWIAQSQTEFDIKLISAGLIMLYIFIFGSLLAMIASEVSKMFK